MLKRIIPKTVKAKLLSLIGLSFCVLIGGIVVSTAMERKKTFLQAEELKLQAKYNGIYKAFEDKGIESTAMALVVASMPDVQKAFGSRDREQLQALTQPFFKQEKKASFPCPIPVSSATGHLISQAAQGGKVW